MLASLFATVWFPSSTKPCCSAPKGFTQLRKLVPRAGTPHELQSGPIKLTASGTSQRMIHTINLKRFQTDSRSKNMYARFQTSARKQEPWGCQKVHGPLIRGVGRVHFGTHVVFPRPWIVKDRGMYTGSDR